MVIFFGASFNHFVSETMLLGTRDFPASLKPWPGAIEFGKNRERNGRIGEKSMRVCKIGKTWLKEIRKHDVHN